MGTLTTAYCRLNLANIGLLYVAITKKKKPFPFQVARCRRKIGSFSGHLGGLCRSAHASFQRLAHASFQRLALGVTDAVVPSSLDSIESGQAVKCFGI